MRPLSHLSYYCISGILFCVCSVLLYTSWDYYAPRLNDVVACPAHYNVQLLSFLWLFQGIALIACSSALWSFSDRELEQQGSSLLANYACVFLKVCPSIVKLLQLFNHCQMSTICLDLLFLHECNDPSVRTAFALTVGINWLITALGLIASSRAFPPPYLYEPATVHRTYWSILKDFIYPLGL
ncbi:hypothetical protein BgAZ_402950 [Babesia gibsoni]|uniref:Uncharacterized protein n=1 Tax=Babesia gibsoni TaxID=33632 RepID=A0AAD8LGM6_BABGI|nr:hypothetical protein BgAZ_402950 [Babesia gibsoni]